MIHTITHFADVQKLEEGLIKPQITKFDIINAAKEITDSFTIQAKMKDIIFDFDYSQLVAD